MILIFTANQVHEIFKMSKFREIDFYVKSPMQWFDIFHFLRVIFIENIQNKIREIDVFENTRFLLFLPGLFKIF